MSLKQVEQAAARVRKQEAALETARGYLRQAVSDARLRHTLAEIGKTLGMTRQGVHDLLNR
jgi:hypothetical protein